jgi:hypothetical protein
MTGFFIFPIFKPMINFFRKTRKKMADDNKPIKYLRYAIGEIVLVVIGILIALSINNWNKERQDRQDEIMILKEIVKNLEIDLEDFDRNIVHFENVITASNTILRVLNEKLVYHDSLTYHMFYLDLFPNFTPDVSGYKLLQSKGLEIVSIDTVRQKIAHLYESRYLWIQQHERRRIDVNLRNISPFKNRYLGSKTIREEACPASLIPNNILTITINNGGIREVINFNEMEKDNELKGAIKEVNSASNLLIYIHRLIKEEVKETITIIEKEIDTRN